MPLRNMIDGGFKMVSYGIGIAVGNFSEGPSVFGAGRFGG
jgi:hypothetical protein